MGAAEFDKSHRSPRSVPGAERPVTLPDRNGLCLPAVRLARRAEVPVTRL